MILLFYGGELNRPNNTLLIEEAARRGVVLKALHYKTPEQEIVWSEVTGVIFRGWYRWSSECARLVKMVSELGIPCVDSGMTKTPDGSVTTEKVGQLARLFMSALPIAKTFLDPATITEFPVVIKDRRGSKGKNVHLVGSELELHRIREENSQKKLPVDFFGEEYIPSDGDYRVIVVGGKALPQALHRRPSVAGEFRSNISLGGVGTAEPLSDEMRDLAERAAQTEQSDFCGVDIIQHRDTKKLYILEVNRFAPGFEGFQKVTGINVAGAVFDLLLL